MVALEKYEDPEPINVGTPGEISILEVVEKVCELLGYDGETYWDLSKPEGQYRKPSCNDRFMAVNGKINYRKIIFNQLKHYSIHIQ